MGKIIKINKSTHSNIGDQILDLEAQRAELTKIINGISETLHKLDARITYISSKEID